MSYYHRYRPQQFSELYGQETVRLILGQALLADRVGHAYLFSGSRGTGKTTTARLLAKAVNCRHRPMVDGQPGFEPCNACELCLSIGRGDCLDVVEIDAASNRGIDEIRDLQEQVRFRPQQATKKVFIIDEVHMLTKEAFNALLKTLEEPPSYLIFILATTELQKVPATVISRCQRFDFRTPAAEAIGEYLAMIAGKEGLSIDPPAVMAIASLARGSFRDASTLLEQLAQTKTITMSVVDRTFGLPQDGLVSRYLDVVAGTADSALLADLQIYIDQGGNAGAFLDLLFDLLASRLSTGQLSASPAEVMAKLIRAKYQMKYSPVAALPLLALVSQPPISEPKKVTSIDTLSDNPAPKTTIEVALAPAELDNSEKKIVIEELSVPLLTDNKKVMETVTITVAQQVPPATLPPTELTALWQKTLDLLMKDNESSLVAILQTARPLGYAQPILTIAVQFKFHADHLTKQKNRLVLEAVLSQLVGQPVRIEPKVQAADDLASAAVELFT